MEKLPEEAELAGQAANLAEPGATPPEETARAAAGENTDAGNAAADEPPRADAEDACLDKHMDQLAAIAKCQQSILEAFEDKLKYDSHKDKVIDELHRELQEYKRGLLKNLLKPLALDLIAAIDGNKKLIASLRKAENAPADKLWQVIEGYHEELASILYRQGIEAFAEAGAFNPGRQKILRVLPSADPAQNKQIAATVAQGYEWDGQILRQELVNVYKYQGSETVNEEAQSK
jgi:molecular chaperone GrpE